MGLARSILGFCLLRRELIPSSNRSLLVRFFGIMRFQSASQVNMSRLNAGADIDGPMFLSFDPTDQCLAQLNEVLVGRRSSTWLNMRQRRTGPWVSPP